MSDTNVNVDELAKDINWKTHVNYLKNHFTHLPSPYASQEMNRITLLYFLLSGADLIGSLETYPKESIINWIYSLQVTLTVKGQKVAGWRGSNFVGFPFNDDSEDHPEFGEPHIAMTYVALALLLILGDDLSKVKKKEIVQALSLLQNENGSVRPLISDSESDMRYVYCACTISYILNDWSGLNQEKLIDYMLKSQSWDYAIGQGPFEESHGGSTYCALASLSLMGKIDSLPHRDKLLKWLILRQTTGFQGRPNKLIDTCYSFWVGASLKILGQFDLVVEKHTRNYTMSCQKTIGGFGKWPDQYPDLLHTYFSLCGLSFIGEKGLAQVHPGVGFSQSAHDRLLQIHPNFKPAKY